MGVRGPTSDVPSWPQVLVPNLGFQGPQWTAGQQLGPFSDPAAPHHLRASWTHPSSCTLGPM